MFVIPAKYILPPPEYNCTIIINQFGGSAIDPVTNFKIGQTIVV